MTTWPVFPACGKSTRAAAITVWAIATVALFLLPLFNGEKLLQGQLQLASPYIDSGIYAQGVAAFWQGQPIYDMRFPAMADGSFDLPFTYPPFAALFLAPMAVPPFMVTKLVTNLITVAATCAVCYLAIRASGWDVSRRTARWWAVALIPVIEALQPVQQTFNFGQINAVLMVMVVYDLLGKHKYLPRGVLVGMAAAVKLTPAVFGLYFLVKRDIKGVVTCVVSGLAWTAVAWAIRPDLSYEYWTVTLRDPTRIGGMDYVFNQSLRGGLARLVTPDSTAVWALGCVIVIAAVAAAMMRIHRDADNSTMLVALNALVALVCSPISWAHHWVWLEVLLIGYAAALAARIAERGHLRVILALAAVGVFTLVESVLPFFLSYPANDHREQAWNGVQQILGGTYVLLAAVAIAVCLIAPGLFRPRAFGVHPCR